MFIATKLFLPPIQPGLVSRPRLFDVLDDAWNTGQRLILLSAPPGYGKTTLLSEWIAVQDTPAIWLALDDKDNDPVRFFSIHAAGLKTTCAWFGRTVVHAEHPPCGQSGNPDH